MKKKFLAILLTICTALCLFALAGCKDKDKPDDTQSSVESTLPSDSESSSSDDSSSDGLSSSEDEHTHSYSTQITPPTCTTQGYTTYTCACGDTYNGDYKNAMGHSYTTQITSPSCTTQGYTTYTCACGDTYNGDYKNATGHSYTNYISNNDATYESDGTKTAVCDRDNCNKTDTVTDEGTKIVRVQISFNTLGGSEVPSIVEYPSIQIKSPEPPIKENYIFQNWQLNGVDYEFSIMPQESIELIAVWAFFEDGTKEYPFVIEDKEDYFKFVDNVNNNINSNKNYILSNSIDFFGETVKPIKEFTGVLDGRGNSIFNFCLSELRMSGLTEQLGNSNGGYQVVSVLTKGLIIVLGENASVINLNVNIEITCHNTEEIVYIGGLVCGNIGGTIRNCTIQGEILNTGSNMDYVYIGGLVGCNGSIIEIKNPNTLSASYFTRTSSQESKIEQCYANVTIKDGNSHASIGGLCGMNNANTNISESFSIGEIEGQSQVGGLVGENYGYIENSFSKCNVTSMTNETYGHCYAGGLVGSNQDNGRIDFCYAMGDVKASAPQYAYAGGLVGSLGDTNTNLGRSGTIYCSIAMNLNVQVSGKYANGSYSAIVGNYRGTISNCYYYAATNAYPTKEFISCLHTQLNNINLYQQSLGWNENIWAFDELDILNLMAPQLQWYIIN